MEEKSVFNLIDRLINFGLKNSLIAESDECFAINRILNVLLLESYEKTEIDENENLECAEPILNGLLDFAADTGVLKSNTITSRDALDTEIMACLMPRPSEVIAKYNNLYQNNKKSATDYYYNLSKASNYIRVNRVKKDMLWKTPTKYGDITITINLSKPEKDPKDIAAARKVKSSSYPKCLLCKENEGFSGTGAKPARANHRIIPMTINSEKWFMQYSPYVYYNEHCIFFKGEHSPMAVNRKSFERLLEIITVLPHYFVGSNADLPIVGGSILTHDHFQGGCAEFPMANANTYKSIKFDGFDSVEAGLVDWAMSVIRIKGTDKKELVDLADKILTNWREYSDENAEILAFTEGVPHNTITPISRFRNGKYELDLVLRNNRTSDEFPLGIFHPHPQYHHIKKENIGLIEVMGLAILPARLKKELSSIEYYLLNPEKEEELFNDEALSIHKDWYLELKKKNPTKENVKEIIKDSVGVIFSEILENAGVYKRTENGINSFLKFVDYVNKK
ncbi:MAG: UDP-glucose--hexose-1-phosphate uridylyltransferase [Oscillospiraceae bacterium]